MSKLLPFLTAFLIAVPTFADRTYQSDSVDKSAIVRIIDATDGSAETGVVAATSGLDLEYVRVGSAPVDLTESDLGSTSAAHTDGGIIHLGNGRYRVDLPDAAYRSGVVSVDVQGSVTGMIVVPETITLTSNVPAQIPGLLWWLEPRLGGLFQDSAGTATPVTANNDPTAYVPDLSGNGWNATQTTAGNRPLYKTTGLSSTFPSLFFDGTADNINLGATVGNTQGNSSITRVYLIQPEAIVSNGFYVVGYKAGPLLDAVQGVNTLSPSGATVGARFNRDAYSGSTGIGPGNLATSTPYLVVVQQRIVYPGNGTTASNTFRMLHERIWINGSLSSDQYQTLTAWNTGTDWTLGGSGASNNFNGHIGFAAAYVGDVTPAHLNLLGTYISRNFGIAVGDHNSPTRTGLPIGTFYVGDSLTKAIGASGHPWPLVASRLLSDKFVTIPYNFGISGLAATSGDTNLRFIMVPGENIAFFFLGTNSIGSGTSAATTITHISTKCAELKALGMKVVVFTVPDRQAGFSGGATTASFETDRQTVNTSVRANYLTYADALIDVGLDGNQIINGTTYDWSVLGDADASSDTTYFTDGTHLAISSHYLIAGAVADTVRSLVGNTTNLANRTTITNLDSTVASRASQTSVDTLDDFVDTEVAAILVDTAEIGVAGAGLTNIDLPNQTMNITGSITGNLSGSVGSVTGAVGSVTGNVGGNVTGSVGSISGVTFPSNFASLAINASGHISRVTLADTITTYTGNTPQTGDTFALANGANGFAALMTVNNALTSDMATTLTNIAAIPTAVWASGTRTLSSGANIVLAKGTGITGFNDLDATGVRTAVGLASANMDTQLGDLPTNAELDTALAGIEVALDPSDLQDIIDGVTAEFTVAVTYVEDGHIWKFNNVNDTYANNTIYENVTFDGLLGMNFSKVIPQATSIASITATVVVLRSGAAVTDEITLGTATITADKKTVHLSAEIDEAGEYVVSITILTVDSQTFTRKGRLIVP
jgi:lysophospholipase L1-like esterase